MEEIVVLYHDYDIIVIPLAIIAFFVLGHVISRKIPLKEDRRYFRFGLALKLFATLVYGLVVQYYFEGGDTNRYYVAIQDLQKAIADNPANIFRIYGNIKLSTDSPLAYYFATDKCGDNLVYMLKTSNYMVPRFGLPFSYIFGWSYTALSMCYSFFAFWGCWKCYTLFGGLYPQVKKGLALAFLFYPSVVYWGSAIMKDSLCLGSLGLFIFLFYKIFFEKKVSLKNIAVLIFWGGVIFFTKPYLILSILPSLSLWLFLTTYKKIKDRSLRMAAFAVLLVLISASLFYLIQFMLTTELLELDKYKGDNILQFAASSQENYNITGGASFSIGKLDGSLSSFLIMFPKAINASLFRPYLWETQSPIILISALESLVIFGTFLYLLVKLGVLGLFRKIFASPMLTFLFVYSVFFSGIVAITNTNFGSLARYKIQAMPFFVTMLVILLATVPNIRQNKLISKYIFSKNGRNNHHN